MFKTFRTIAFYEIRVTATSRVKRFYLRDEFAPNTREHARRYDSLQAAQDALRATLTFDDTLVGYGTIGVPK